jgi:hypothetical protein
MPSTQDLKKYLDEAQRLVAEYGKPIVHYGFIPAIIVAGMLFTKPRPTVGQLLFLG